MLSLLRRRELGYQDAHALVPAIHNELGFDLVFDYSKEYRPAKYSNRFGGSFGAELGIGSSHEDPRGIGGNAVHTLDIDLVEGRYLLAGNDYGDLSIYDILGDSENQQHNNKDDSTLPFGFVGTLGRAAALSESSPQIVKPFATTNINPDHNQARSRHRKQKTAYVSKAQWYPSDSAIFISAGSDGCVYTWDSNALQVVVRVDDLHEEYMQNTAPVVDMAMPGCLMHSAHAANRKLVAIARRGREHISLADITTGLVTQNLDMGYRNRMGSVPEPHGSVERSRSSLALSASPSSICWSPQSDYQLAVGGSDGALRLFDIRRAGIYSLIHAFNIRSTQKGSLNKNVMKSVMAVDRLSVYKALHSFSTSNPSASSSSNRRKSASSFFGQAKPDSKRLKREPAPMVCKEEALVDSPTRPEKESGWREPILSAETTAPSSLIIRPIKNASHSGHIHKVLFDQSGRVIYSHGSDGTLRSWDVLRGSVIIERFESFQTRTAVPLSKSPNSDALYLAQYHAVMVFDSKTGLRTSVLSPNLQLPATCLFAHPWNHTLYAADVSGRISRFVSNRTCQSTQRRTATDLALLASEEDATNHRIGQETWGERDSDDDHNDDNDFDPFHPQGRPDAIRAFQRGRNHRQPRAR